MLLPINPTLPAAPAPSPATVAPCDVRLLKFTPCVPPVVLPKVIVRALPVVGFTIPFPIVITVAGAAVVTGGSINFPKFPAF